MGRGSSRWRPLCTKQPPGACSEHSLLSGIELAAALAAVFLGATAMGTVGFGLACFLIHLVPFLGYLALPASVCGATLLSCELDRTHSSS